ncbi:MAG: D-alanyl-D-alanine carboxypeptidase family protein [Pseudomonadota bacterium]
MALMRLFAACVAVLLAIAGYTSAQAQSQDTPATAAFIVDLSSGAILLDKNGDRPMPPASMSKLMTLNMVFEALERGLISMDDKFRTSSRAAAMGGSKMFIRDGELVSIRDLVRGVIVQSGNDSAVALAEALSGTEEAFADLMTQRAQELGMTRSTFVNSTGWPADGHVMSPRDLATLATRLIVDFPEHYTMFAETEFTWDNIEQANRNPLLGLGVGADGLKTGHTEESGYGLVASAKRGQRRVVLVITGLESKAERRHEAERLINWAFRAFETRRLFTAGEELVEAPVWIGETPTVMLAPARDVTVTAPFGTLDSAEVKVHFEGPVPAPIAEGQQIGRIEVLVPDVDPISIPLLAAHDVGEGSFITRVKAAGTLLLSELIP